MKRNRRKKRIVRPVPGFFTTRKNELIMTLLFYYESSLQQANVVGSSFYQTGIEPTITYDKSVKLKKKKYESCMFFLCLAAIKGKKRKI